MIITTMPSFPSLVLIHIANYIPLSRLVQFQLVCSEWYSAIEELESGEFWNIKFVSYYSEKRKFYERFLNLYRNDTTLSKRLKFVEKNQQMMLKKLKHNKSFSRQQLKQAVISEWYQYYITFFKYEGHHVGLTNFYNILCSLPEKSHQERVCSFRARQLLRHTKHLPQAVETFMFKKSNRFLLPLLKSDTCTNDHLSVICEKVKPRFDFFTASLYFDKISLRLSNPLSTNCMKYILESYQTFPIQRKGMKELFVNNCFKLIPMSQRNAEFDVFLEHVTLYNNGDAIQSIITETSFAKIIIGALKYKASLHDIRILSEKLGRQVPASILIERPPSEDFFSCYYDLDLRQDVKQLSKKLHETFENDRDTLLLESIVLELDINLFQAYNGRNIMAKILSLNEKQLVEKLITILKKQAEKNNNKYGYFDGDVINWRKFDPCGVWMHNVRCRYGLGYEIKYSVTSAWPLIQQSNAIFHHSTLIAVGLWKHIVLYPEICEGLKQRTRVFLEMSNDTEGIPLTQFMLEHFNMDIMDQLVNIPLSEISIRLKNFRINGNKPLPEL